MAFRYKLAAGTQVREEDFGLLFYTRQGPQLYFLSSGKLLRCEFFESDMTLTQWLQNHCDDTAASARQTPALKNALTGLKDKGVLLEF